MKEKMLFKDKFPFKKVAVVGAGYIGSVLSALLADRGLKVVAIDNNPEILEFYKKKESPVNEPGLSQLIKKVIEVGNLTISSDISSVKNSDVILITVGTPLKENGTADKSAIKSVVTSLGPYIKDEQLIIVKSTVPPGTTKNDVADPLRAIANVNVAFCPERLAEGNAINECRQIPVVVGGIDKKSTEKAKQFWKGALDIDCLEVENAKAAELVKLANNSWIDLNIALAFELAKVADHLDIDILPVIKAANSLPKGEHNVNLLLPSIGVGGYCLTKDPLFLNSFAKSFGSSFKTALTSREVNNSMPIYSAQRIDETIKKQFSLVEIKEIKIAILGLAFKNNTGDCRFTPTLPAINYLKDKGYDIRVFDDKISEKDCSLFQEVNKVNSIDEAISNCHVLAFFAGHKEFHDIKLNDMKKLLQKGAIIFDGRMFFSSSKIESFKKAGFIFIGVGR